MCIRPLIFQLTVLVSLRWRSNFFLDSIEVGEVMDIWIGLVTAGLERQFFVFFFVGILFVG